MGTFTKSGARKPLAAGKIGVSYGMRFDINEGQNGVTFGMEGADGKRYSCHVTNAELDSAILTRQMFAPQHDLRFDDAALELAKSEREKDERGNVVGLDQAMKALDMAYTMLRTFVPGTEQDRNGTLAYIASVARY